MKIVKRPVSLGDAELILRWRNSASARNASRSPNEITDFEHGNWFGARLSRVLLEPFWIVSILEKEIGYVRLDRVEDMANSYMISIFIIPEFRGLGNGQRMLKEALESAISEIPVTNFRAVIRKSNKSSIALFQKFGFRSTGDLDTDFELYQVNVDEMSEDENSF